MTLQQRYDTYQKLWDNMIIKRPDQVRLDAIAIQMHIDRYKAFVLGTKIPWYFVGLIHYRESNCNFNKHLHNGDSLQARTHDVPAGRPLEGNPPFTWEQSAKDALFTMKKMDTYKDWGLVVMLYRLESYNGNGYRKPEININSPYVWSYTNHYTAGKYIRDHVFDPKRIDDQIGCAPLLSYLTDKTLKVV